MANKNKPRIPVVEHLPVTFHAKETHVVAVFELGPNQTIGLRFESPEMMLEFFSKMMEKATLVWPNNEWVKEYWRD